MTLRLCLVIIKYQGNKKNIKKMTFSYFIYYEHMKENKIN